MWAKFLDQWASVQTGADTLIVGDLNLDHQKWMSPDPVNQYMVEDTKNKIETLGFVQYVKRTNKILERYNTIIVRSGMDQ